MLEVKRSPARVSWWVVCNGTCILTKNTRKEAKEKAKEYSAKYGLAFKG